MIEAIFVYGGAAIATWAFVFSMYSKDGSAILTWRPYVTRTTFVPYDAYCEGATIKETRGYFFGIGFRIKRQLWRPVTT